MSKDLIDRAKLVATIVNTPTENQHTDVLSALAFRQIEILNIIENAPTVRPEVRRGKWIQHGDATIECSECGSMFEQQMIPFDYCPDCGCDMWEVEHETD